LNHTKISNFQNAFIFVVLFFVTSCHHSILKRHYNKGFYVSHAPKFKGNQRKIPEVAQKLIFPERRLLTIELQDKKPFLIASRKAEIENNQGVKGIKKSIAITHKLILKPLLISKSTIAKKKEIDEGSPLAIIVAFLLFAIIIASFIVGVYLISLGGYYLLILPGIVTLIVFLAIVLSKF